MTRSEMAVLRDAEEIAIRHAIGVDPVLYWLLELKLSPAVAEILASFADHGYHDHQITSMARTLAASQKVWLDDADV